MASIMAMSSSATLAGCSGLSSALISRSRVSRPTASRGFVRCQASEDPKQAVQDRSNSALKTAQQVVDSTKVNISKEDVLKHQEENKSEQASFLGTKPAENSMTFPRDELERRPETGDNSFESVMSIDGAGPETINSRLAMLGVFIALSVEATTGKRIFEQVFGAGGDSRLLWFFGLSQLIFVASLIPFANRESPDSRKFGPFTAQAERWNGRLAMLGFAGIVLVEWAKGSALIPQIFH